MKIITGTWLPALSLSLSLSLPLSLAFSRFLSVSLRLYVKQDQSLRFPSSISVAFTRPTQYFSARTTHFDSSSGRATTTSITVGRLSTTWTGW